MRWPRRRLIGVVRRLDIEPGDRFVITFPRRITAEEARHVAEVIRVRLRLDAEVNPVGILDDGATAMVVRGKTVSPADRADFGRAVVDAIKEYQKRGGRL